MNQESKTLFIFNQIGYYIIFKFNVNLQMRSNLP